MRHISFWGVTVPALIVFRLKTVTNTTGEVPEVIPAIDNIDGSDRGNGRKSIWNDKSGNSCPSSYLRLPFLQLPL